MSMLSLYETSLHCMCFCFCTHITFQHKGVYTSPVQANSSRSSIHATLASFQLITEGTDSLFCHCNGYLRAGLLPAKYDLECLLFNRHPKSDCRHSIYRCDLKDKSSVSLPLYLCLSLFLCLSLSLSSIHNSGT